MDNISLTPSIREFLQNQVASGLYNSLNEAINANLQIIITQQGNFSLEDIEAFNAEIQKGIDDYEAGRYRDGETAFKELMAKYAA